MPNKKRNFLSDIIKETLFRATKKNLLLTPFNYYKIFIEVALEYGLSEAEIHRYVYGTDLYVLSEEVEQMKKKTLEIAKNIENTAENVQQSVEKSNDAYREVVDTLTGYRDPTADEISNEIEKILYISATLKAELDAARKTLEKQKEELKKLKEFSFKDQLTGLYARKYMEEALNTVLYNFNRYSRPCSIIMFDIDDFKKINDVYGHLAGDAVLRTVASVVQRIIRRSDIPVRYGGDEFIVILPDTMLEDAVSVAEKIANKIQSIKFEKNGLTFKCTISIGITHIKDGDTVETLLERVDKALYETKNKGKKGITVIK